LFCSSYLNIIYLWWILNNLKC
jgi:hypothetical protein